MAKRTRPRLQRWIQAATLLLFLALLWQTAWPFTSWLAQHLPPDSFLRLDPAGMLTSALAARAWLPGAGALLLTLLATAIVGRFFCGMLCPMGTTIDITDRLLLGPAKERRPLLQRDTPQAVRLRRLKYLLLLFILTAAAMGVSYAFMLAPIPLITRLYALLLHPLLMALGDQALALARPMFDAMGLSGLYYSQIAVPRFATQLFIIVFFAGIFALALMSPRFWCRHLCPAGAIFALFSLRPLLRRRVSEDCVECGACQRECPMGAIPENPLQTRHSECISCQRCTQICPVQAIDFSKGRVPSPAEPQVEAHQPARRAFLFAGLFAGAFGVGGALTAVTGLHSPHVPKGKGTAAPPEVIRPPGALPEDDFLARCVRCGECMKVCPTNTLQPIGLEYGISGIFSPTLFPMRGPCEPTCRACGFVCPTGALRTLPSQEEKISAKLGTARVLRYKCLAWEHDRKCLVCDEVCPYDAIVMRPEPGLSVPVPVVLEDRCAGCGFCEHHCPVREERAIVVEPMGALRLASGSYADTARADGLELSIKGHGGHESQAAQQGYPQRQEPYGSEGLPPGFSEPDESSSAGQGGLPPGFSDPPDTQ